MAVKKIKHAWQKKHEKQGKKAGRRKKNLYFFQNEKKCEIYFFLHKLTESENSRHWIALCRDNIYYFDSYGKPADEPQKWNTKGIMKPNLLDDNFNVFENDKDYQKHAYLMSLCQFYRISEYFSERKTFKP